jgi:hypothetical protein
MFQPGDLILIKQMYVEDGSMRSTSVRLILERDRALLRLCHSHSSLLEQGKGSMIISLDEYYSESDMRDFFRAFDDETPKTMTQILVIRGERCST